ncbi:PI-PLC X domain-containing protein [Camellia lanceoleosa]|uniref:PI-PLC X domain-containing protein n=1 Tax=Camellia lanceoleosa TaxID=1840588 RepID=A0ACC0G3M2_9ERIC|nr:PI-PLC X domain-containing protein [Camellia lanceoleosa]
MSYSRFVCFIVASVFYNVIVSSIASSNGECQLKDKWGFDKGCDIGLYCSNSSNTFDQQCAKSVFSNPFKIVNNSLPFNKFAFLTSHNSYATHTMSYSTKGGFYGDNEDTSITQQLNSGVRALMLNIFDYKGDVWLCHGCDYKTGLLSHGPALGLFNEVEAFLTSNSYEIVTLILEDRVDAEKNTLGKAFDASGLTKYLFPLSKMPLYGEDWPLVKDMVIANQRLVVFSSSKSKQESEGIAYQWNFMVEYKFGSDGMHTNHGWSLKLNNTSKSLVLFNYADSKQKKKNKNYHSTFDFTLPKEINTKDLISTIKMCYTSISKRWPNFIAVDYGKRTDGGAVFEAVDFLNGKLLCGCEDVNSCQNGSLCTSDVDDESQNHIWFNV